MLQYPTHRCSFCEQPLSGNALVVGDHIIHRSCERPYRKALRGLTHPCPQCATTGKVKTGKTVTTREEVPIVGTPPCAYNGCRGCWECQTGMTMEDVTRPVMGPCPLCKGEGYLREEPKPVVGIVGWERGPDVSRS